MIIRNAIVWKDWILSIGTTWFAYMPSFTAVLSHKIEIFDMNCMRLFIKDTLPTTLHSLRTNLVSDVKKYNAKNYNCLITTELNIYTV